MSHRLVQVVAPAKRAAWRHDVSDGFAVVNALVASGRAEKLLGAVGEGGLQGNNVAIIIGAAVIAPLLGPIFALALGTTLGDPAMIRRAARTAFAGAAVALVLSIVAQRR